MKKEIEQNSLQINLSNITINAEEYRKARGASGYVFLLHGFSGSSKDWNNIAPLLDNRFGIAAIDLIGHGKSDSPAETFLYSAGEMVQQLYETFKFFTRDRFILLGYSMGGRAALSFAVEYPEMIKGLILESSSAGIKENHLREERVRSDEDLAKFIGRASIEEFVNYWMNIDLFKTQKKLPREKLSEIREEKLNCSKIGLANSLRGFGTGTMPPLYDKLNLIEAKTLLITGETDSKYSAINKGVKNLFPSAYHKVIKEAGHNVHLEQPELFADAVNTFLNEL